MRSPSSGANRLKYSLILLGTVFTKMTPRTEGVGRRCLHIPASLIEMKRDPRQERRESAGVKEDQRDITDVLAAS
jgi:hypothetical protein